MDPSRNVGNGFTYHEKLSSSKLTSVLEAVAGEYALVINGHSLVSVAIFSLGSIFHMAFISYLVLISLDFRGAVVFKGKIVSRLSVAGPRVRGRHGAGVSGDGLCLQSCHLLPGDPLAEGTGGGTG